jgi:DHA1 family tetracycline resistance protein-like MFS transporter
MGSLQSIGSLGVILMPLLGTAILGAASHLPPQDWRIGATFFVCAAMQALAILARRYFRAHDCRRAVSAAMPGFRDRRGAGRRAAAREPGTRC